MVLLLQFISMAKYFFYNQTEYLRLKLNTLNLKLSLNGLKVQDFAHSGLKANSPRPQLPFMTLSTQNRTFFPFQVAPFAVQMIGLHQPRLGAFIFRPMTIGTQLIFG